MSSLLGESVMNDKRIRQLVVVILGIIVALGALSLVSTLIGMAVPLAILGVGGFAFYKIVLEGRGESEAMADEFAETSGLVVEGKPAGIEHSDEDQEQQAKERLSAIERARSAYVDQVTPAEEILAQIRARKEGLPGDDET